jgi:hypothetical protein
MTEVVEWINNYTAVVSSDRRLEKEQTITISSRNIEYSTFWGKCIVKIGRFFVPTPSESIHAKQETVEATVTDVDHSGNTYVVEVRRAETIAPTGRGSRLTP